MVADRFNKLKRYIFISKAINLACLEPIYKKIDIYRKLNAIEIDSHLHYRLESSLNYLFGKSHAFLKIKSRYH